VIVFAARLFWLSLAIEFEDKVTLRHLDPEALAGALCLLQKKRQGTQI
jgi:hypothetical protein